MRINEVSLLYFRNYKEKIFSFEKGTTLIIGPNASGKTNLLEALYLLARGKSFRAELVDEMISYQEQLARINGVLTNGVKLEVILTRGEINGKRVGKKIFKVNDINRRMVDFIGQFLVVYFGPDDLAIVTDSPTRRRDYLDEVLEQVDQDYRRALLSYKKGLHQRNKLLEQIRDEGKPRSVLYFWDKLLITNGEVITSKREELINFINRQPEYFGKIFLEYKPSIISSLRLEKYAEEEVAAGMTLVGPHRDDFEFRIKNSNLKFERDLSKFGSRGEQRLAIFCLKIAELEFMAKKTGHRPVLLLDDIFSELDQKHRSQLLEVIPHQQTIITVTDLHLVDPDNRAKMKIIQLY